MKKAVSILVITSFSLLQGCTGSSSLPPLSYVQYLEHAGHDMVRTVDYGNLSYKVQLATPQYVASKETGDEPSGEGEFTKRLQELEGYLFFYITIESGRQSKMADPSLAEEKVSYYAQSAAADIRLKSDQGILTPVTYHFEDHYGLSPYHRIIVAFKTAPEQSRDFQLVFNDRFNNNFPVKASFTSKSIAQLPTLEIQ